MLFNHACISWIEKDRILDRGVCKQRIRKIAGVIKWTEICAFVHELKYSNIGSLFFWAIFLIKDNFTEKDVIERVVGVVVIWRRLLSFSMD